MDNQHRLIQTYRELSPEEIEMMNQCKVLEAQVLEMHDKLLQKAKQDLHDAIHEPSDSKGTHDRIKSAENAVRSAAVAKTELQTGFMWLVRSVARPSEPELAPAPSSCNCGPDEACSDCPA